MDELIGVLNAEAQLTGNISNEFQLTGQISNAIVTQFVSDCILEFNTYLVFPNIGVTHTIYVDLNANKLYRWDENNLTYYIVGSDYNDIDIINGGTSIL